MNMLQKILGSWEDPIRRWNMESDLSNTIKLINNAFLQTTVYPDKGKIFNAFRKTNYDNLKVVLLFQDPYHDGSATGIAIANSKNSKIVSPTLRVFIDEYFNDLDVKSTEFDISMETFCEKGVMPLNCALTVEKGAPESHLFLWRTWTEKFLVNLTMEKKDLVFVLFGNKAKTWRDQIINGVIINSVHPAAEVYSHGKSGFYNSNIFTAINKQLVILKKEPIEW